MKVYRELLNEPYFMPEITLGENVELPVKLRWGGAEDADGIALKVAFEKNPVFARSRLTTI